MKLQSGEEELAFRLDHYKAKAMWHILLIRHTPGTMRTPPWKESHSCINFLSENVKGQVIIAAVNGGDGVLTYTSDLWLFLHNIAVLPTTAVKPQHHKPVRSCD